MSGTWKQSDNPIVDAWRGINGFLARFLTPAVRGILVANVVVFILFVLLTPFSRGILFFFLALMHTPALAVGKLWIWEFVTYMFMHATAFHLLMNMLILWFFGPRLEYRWGTREFLRFYFIVGVGAAIFHTVVAYATGNSGGPPMLGASGAIYGIMLACALYWPDDIILLYMVIPIRLKYLMIFLGVLTFFSSVGAATSGNAGGIAHVTHLGGLLVALLYLKGGPWLRGKRWTRRRARVYQVDPNRHPDFH